MRKPFDFDKAMKELEAQAKFIKTFAIIYAVFVIGLLILFFKEMLK